MRLYMLYNIDLSTILYNIGPEVKIYSKIFNKKLHCRILRKNSKYSRIFKRFYPT